MSDAQDTSTSAPVDEGARYDAFLASWVHEGAGLNGLPKVTVDVNAPTLKNWWLDKPKLNGTDAARVLNVRIADVAGEATGDTRTSFKAITDYVLLSLPEAAWTNDMLSQLDLRPYLANLQKWGEAVAQVDPDSRVHDNEKADAFASAAAAGLTAQQKIIDQLVGEHPDTDPNRGAQYEYSNTEAGPSPEAQTAAYDAAVGVATQNGQAAPNFSQWAQGKSDTLEAITISEQEVRDAFALTYSSDALKAMEVGSNLAQGGAQVEMPTVDLVGSGAPSLPGDPGYNESGRMPANRLSINKAAGWLMSMNVTPASVKAMQDKLVQAGYMDGMQGRVNYGDGWDPLTNAAWSAALADSIKRNVPLPQLLASKTQERRSRLPDISAFKEGASFDLIAQNLLGRNLSDAEKMDMVRYLEGLRDQPMPNANGIPQVDAQGNVIGYTQAGMHAGGFSDQDVQTRLQSELANEMLSRQVNQGGVSAWAAEIAQQNRNLQ